MSIFYIFLGVSLLKSLHVSTDPGCDQNCTDKPEFTPSRLVVKYGDATGVKCSVCQDCLTSFDWEVSVGEKERNGNVSSWTVGSLTEWGLYPMCYYTMLNTGHQCCSILPLTLYKPPDFVSISFVNHTGPMLEGRQYALQCSVDNVAPVQNLSVTFYRGHKQLGPPQSSSNPSEKPVTETFSFNFSPTKEDDGGQIWCEAKLLLGPEGPQPPPVVKSKPITATVHYKPQLVGSSHPDPITVIEGDPLKLKCSAVGNPKPSYTWTTPSLDVTTSKNDVFTIKSVTPADEGKYTCSVTNNMGNTTVEFIVTVKGLDVIPTTVENPTTVTNPTTVRSPTIVRNPTTVTSPTTVATTTERNRSSSSVLIHRFIWCLALLVSVLV